MFCTKCGTKNADGAKFCAGCGQSLAAPEAPVYAAPVVEPTPVEPQAPVYAAPAVEPTPVEPQAPVYAAPVVEPTPVQPQAPYYAAPAVEPVAPAPAPQKPKKNNTGLIVGIIVGVLVLIGAVIAILFATGVFETDSKKEDTKTEETGNKKQDKDEDEETKEEETEAPKGDENHDGRFIGKWEGTETGEVEGYEMNFTVTYHFYEDGTYEMLYDYNEYKTELRRVMLLVLADSLGVTQSEAEEAFKMGYGMSLDEYIEQTIQAGGIDEINKGTWETNGSQIISKADGTEQESPLEYSFSADGNTLYLSGDVAGTYVDGEYTRVG